MRDLIKEYFGLIMYVICGIIIILSSFCIIINVNHSVFLNEKVIVQEMDNNYKKFKNNVLKIESCTKKNNLMNNVLAILKKDGVYRLLPGDEIYYGDVYRLNNYFLDEVINNGWVSDLKTKSKYNKVINNEYINNLIKNANYINKELFNNSNYQYNILGNEFRDVLMEEYSFVLNNYYSFSTLILNLCEGD